MPSPGHHRLAVWEEHRGAVSGQAVAVARTVSRRAMREFGLSFDAEGRIVERKPTPPQWKDELIHAFPMRIGEETVEVRYTRNPGIHWISFVGQELPPPGEGEPPRSIMNRHKPHPLSDSGWWSQAMFPDAVEAVGGAEAFAALLVQAKLAGREKEFMEQFEGRHPDVKRKKGGKRPVQRASAESMPVLGEHTAAVAEERQAREPQVEAPQAAERPEKAGEPEATKKAVQGLLF